MIGSEALPFAKTGGLADVLGALPPALARLGWDVTVALPSYRGVDAGTILERFPVTVGGFTRDVAIHEAPLADGARAWLVDCPDLFDREAPHGTDGTDYPDNALRFAMLVRADAGVCRAPERRRRRSCTRTTGRRDSRRSI